MNKSNLKTKLAALITVAMLTISLSGCQPLELLEKAIGVNDTIKGLLESRAELNSEIEERQSSYTSYGYHALCNDAERELYALIDISSEGLVPQEFLVDKSVKKNINDVIDLYKNDCPEVFWLGDKYNYEYYEDGEYLYIKLLFSTEGSELKKAKETFEQAIDSALENAPYGGSDYEKELYVNDYLIDCCEYDYDAAETKEVIGFEHTAYGALVDGRAVCEGYTRAFQLLCERLGVGCVSINGTCDDTSTVFNGNHIWNAVKIDGEWYQTDVTWNDYETEDEEYFVSSVETHLYFNLTTEEITKDHTINPIYSGESGDVIFNSFVPECASTEYSYFKQSFPVLDSFDHCEGLKNLLAQAVARGEEKFEFSVSDSLDYGNTIDKLTDGTAYEWFKYANEQNDSEHQLSDNCLIYRYEIAPVIVFKLDYI